MSFVCLLEIQLHFPDNGSLKGKRKELSSLKAQLQRRFGAAVAETGYHDLWQRSELTAALVGREAGPLRDRAAAVERYVISMFPDGAKEPFERTRRVVRKLAVPLKALPNRVSVTGHTAASRVPPRPGYGPWELSADRANAVRQILEDEGLPTSHMFMVAGKADSQPLFPDDPHIAANRRVTITLMREAPPLPAGFKP